MKKVTAILLIPIFLLMTAGVAVTSLYCKGSLAEVGIAVDACCDDVNKGGCCNTQFEVLKVQDAFLSSSVSFDAAAIPFLFLPSVQMTCLPGFSYSSHFKTYRDKAPPSEPRALYILFRSLII